MLNNFRTVLARQHRSRQRLFSRPLLSICAVGSLLLAAGIYGAWRVHRLHQRGSEMLSSNVASIRAAEEFEMAAREVRYRLKRHLSSGHERHLEQVNEKLPAVLAALDQAAVLAKSEREQRLVQRLRDGCERFHADFESLPAALNDELRTQILFNLADEVIPNKLLVYSDRYIKLNEEELHRSNERNESTANHLMFGLLLLGAGGSLAGMIAGYGIARLVNRRIVKLAIPLRDTAGKLSQVAGPVSVVAEPGFDDLESILNSVSDHVTTVVERLQDSERDRLRAEQLAVLGRLSAGLAHELRNPLTSMKAILQLAEGPADLSSRDLEILREESERLEHSVQSLLDFARPPQLRKSLTDLGALLEQTARLARRRAERQAVELTYVPPVGEVVLMADAAHVRQVVLNLLLNAIEAMLRGGRVRLECRLENPQGPPVATVLQSQRASAGVAGQSCALIRVSDTGPGLPKQLGERIFEPFVTTKATGTGLGLSICQQIVEAHDGRLDARNASKGGAVFEVRLPLAAADVNRVATPRGRLGRPVTAASPVVVQQPNAGQ